jgi:hypothetical protein
MSNDTATIKNEIATQPSMAAGTLGWWKVWGAGSRHIQAGDFVVTANDEFFVQGVWDTNDAHVFGFIADGKKRTVGILCPVKVIRHTTCNTLAD